MAMPYEEAALRHLKDSTFLDEHSRFDNADQLAGLAAECAIKIALSRVSRCRDPEKPDRLAEYYRHHIDVLWDRARIQGYQRVFPGLAPILAANNPFSDWCIDQRYEDDGYVSEEARKRHLRMVGRLLGAVGLRGSRQEA